MSDSKRSNVPDDDPFLEFPSERDFVTGLTRRLRGDEKADEPGGDKDIGSVGVSPETLSPPAASRPPAAVLPPTAPKPDSASRARRVSGSDLLLGQRRRPVPPPSPRSALVPEPPKKVVPLPTAVPVKEPESKPALVDDLTDQVRAKAIARSSARSKGVVAVAAFVVIAGFATVAFVYSQRASDSAADVPQILVAPETTSATITSRPEGARVVIDGVDRGQTPLTLDLPVGEHGLEVQRGDEQATRLPLNVERDTSVSAHVELAESAPPAVTPRATPATGWLSIDIPVDLLIREDGRVIGTTAADRLALSAGRHQLELVSEALEFRAVVDVVIAPGGASTATVTLPNGSLSISALPWANVSVDGRALGATPLGSLSLPIGDHEVVWTHPQFGERRRTVTVTAQTPVRVGVDFSR